MFIYNELQREKTLTIKTIKQNKKINRIILFLLRDWKHKPKETEQQIHSLNKAYIENFMCLSLMKQT